MKWTVRRALGLGLLCAASVHAGSYTNSFNSSTATNLLDFGGSLWDGVTTTGTGSAAWIPSGGAGPIGSTANGPVGGVAGDGYLQLTFANASCPTRVAFSSYLCGGVLFDDFDNGLAVGGFTVECDLRLGNGGPAPADGLSINFVRSNDPVLTALAAGDSFPQMNGRISPNGGRFSDNGNGVDISLMEEGTTTGLSVGFDMWDSGNYIMPPVSPAVGVVAPGLAYDNVGLDIRLDNVLLTTVSMPNGTVDPPYDDQGNAVAETDPNGNNAATDWTAIETGPYDGTGCDSTLSWVHLKVDLSTNSVLNVWWKNHQIVTNLATGFAPSPGRLLMAARVGGNTANIEVDNVQITTIPFGSNVPPVAPMVTQPPRQIVAAGGTAVFSVAAAGTPPLSCQWWFNNTSLTGATNVTLVLSNVQPAQAGHYLAVVSNTFGCVTSAPSATLIVLEVTPPLTWTNPAPIIYGTALGTGQLNATASVAGTSLYLPSGGVLSAGADVLSVVFTPSGSSVLVTGSVVLVVLQAPLIVTADNLKRPYGTANPPLTGTITGLANGDDITATYSCAATPASPAGTYPIVPSLADPDNRLGNYALTVIDGTVTVAAQPPAGSQSYAFTNFAGMPGVSGSADGTGSAARFYFPVGVAVDSLGNLFVGDQWGETIRKVTPAGAVTTLAGLAGSPGSADGTGSAARFNNPSGVALDAAGNIYVADASNDTIRKVTPAGVVTTLAGLAVSPGSADGSGSAARFNYPTGVALDSAGNVYVADCLNRTIRKVTPAGVVTTLAGLAGSPGSADGTGSAARFNNPSGVALDAAGNVYVGDGNNEAIRKVTPAGVVTTLAGLMGSSGSADGSGSAARFNYPLGVALDAAGNVYVADEYNHTIRRVTPGGVVTTLAGLAGSPGSADGSGSAAQFNYPGGVALDNAGNVYVADTLNDRITRGLPSAIAQDQFVCTTNNGTITITGYRGSGGAVGIPSTINGLPVASIGGWAFDSCTSLTNVMIPDSVTSIGDEAFYNCTRLTGVTIGSSVTSIGSSAFYGCGLTSVTIPNSVTSIGHGAFDGCTGLTSVTIGNSVSSIGDSAFPRCTSLSAITVDALNRFYSSVDGVLFNKSQTTLIQCPGGKAGTYAIPNGVTSIGNVAFSGCASLTSVTVPNSVTSIGSGAFSGCTNLTGITIPNSVTIIWDDAFGGCARLTSVTIPNSVTNIGFVTFDSCSNLSSVTVGSGVTSIGPRAFADCPGLTSVYFQGNAPNADSSVFAGDNQATVYCLPGTTGWGTTFGGLPIGLWGSAPPAVAGISLEVSANPLWTDTAMTVTNGETVDFTATGSWSGDGGNVWAGPGGVPGQYDWDLFCYSAPHHSLIAYAGVDPYQGHWGDSSFYQNATGYWLVGTNAQITFDTSGELWLGMNDDAESKLINDNYGSMHVVITPAATTVLPGPGITGFGGSGTGWTLNGQAVPAAVTNDVLYITAGDTYGNARSAFFNVPQDVSEFAVSFTYQNLTAPNQGGGLNPADGMVFTLQNQGLTALGGIGSGLGYVGISPATGVAFNLWNGHVIGIGYAPDAVGNGSCAYASTAPVDLRSLDPINVAIVYDGTTLWVQLADNVANTSFFTNYTVDLVQALGTNMAWVGFTGGTGGGASDQRISQFSMRSQVEGGAVSPYFAMPTAPQSQTVAAGASVSFAVYAQGTAPLHYEWQLDGINLSDNGRITGSQRNVLSIVGVVTNDAGGYQAIVTNAYGSATSVLETLTVMAPFSYTVDHGAVTIAGYTGPGGAVTVPSAINGLPVISIGNQAFASCNALVSVTIPDSVTDIGSHAFDSCQNLCSVSLGNSVSRIEEWAFSGCTRLASLQLPNSLTNLGDWVFAYCYGLTNVAIPSGVTDVASWAFSGCANLTNVTLPTGVTTIGDGAFSQCGLVNLAIPNTVTNIGYRPFGSCPHLVAITMGSPNAFYCSVDGVLFDKAQTTLIQFPAGKDGNYTIPGGVTQVGLYAFDTCPNLTSVTMPNTLTNIGTEAFMNCTGLTNVSIPDSVTSLGDWGFYGCTSLTNVTLSSGLTSIRGVTFDGCTSLTNITIPAAITNIGIDAFIGCQNLRGVYFLGNAPSLDEDVFYDDDNATIYVLPGTTGWGATFGGLPTMLWQPQASGATATATVLDGFVAGASITGGGYGYTNPPTVLIQGGGGTGATATAVVSNGVVADIIITDAGTGYTSAPKVYIGLPTGTVNALVLAAGTNSGVQFSQVLLPIQASLFTNILTFQFSLHWDPTVATFVDVEQFGLPGLGAGSFGTALANSGTLTVSWDDPVGAGETLGDGTTVFALRFGLIGGAGAASSVTLDGTPTTVEVANSDLALLPVQTLPGQLSVAPSVVVAGRVLYYPTNYPPSSPSAQGVAGVTVSLAGAANGNQATAADGSYSLAGVLGPCDYVVTLAKPDDTPPANGVTTLDIALIRRQILGLAPLDSPYKLLAADVRAAGTVTTLDIALIRRLILGLTNTFPVGLWRFVPADYVFPDALNPWGAPTNRCYTNLAACMTGQDYVAIKLGDVNDAWTKAEIGKAESRNLAADFPAVRFEAGGQVVRPGEMAAVPIRVSGFHQATSAQFSLGWDARVLRYAGVGAFGVRGLGEENFGTVLAGSGKLTFSWDDPAGTGLEVADASPLFTVYFEVIGAAGSVSPVTFGDSPTVREATVDVVPGAFASGDGQVMVVGERPVISCGGDAAKGTFRISVPSVNGRQYILEFSDSLSGAHWRALGTVVGDGSVKILRDPAATTQQRFYRVRVE